MPLLDRFAPLRLERLEARENPSFLLPAESFDAAPRPALPNDWVKWSNDGTNALAVYAGSGTGQTPGVVSIGLSPTTTLTWNTQSVDADTGSSVSVFADSLIPAIVFARGQNLGTSTPSYLAAVVTRGLKVEIWQVTAGKVQVLASIQSPSSSYLSSQWVNVSIVPTGDSASVKVTRQDTKQFLNAQGTWQTAETAALTAKVAAPPASGFVGFGRGANYAGTVRYDDFAAIAKVVPPTPEVHQDFNNLMVGAIPTAWQGWSSEGTSAFKTTAPRTGVPTNGFSSNSPLLSNAAARAWADIDLTANVDVSASVYLDSLVSAQVFARGTNLATAKPTYYAVTVTRGLQASLVKVVDGVTTTLATIKSTSYFSSQWIRVRLTVDGDDLRVMITRPDTQQWLQTDGSWSNAPDYALAVSDGSITANGRVGVARAASVTGTATFDDFDARPLGSESPPQVVVDVSGNATADGYVGLVTFQAVATAGTAPITRVEFRLNGVVRSATASAVGSWTFDTTTVPNGTYTLTVRTFDAVGNLGTLDVSFKVDNPNASPIPLPTAPQHYSHIRIAQLAYSGNPMGDFEKNLLQTSVDLVIPNPRYLETIQATSPDTPQLIYTNLSNLYEGLLTDWLQYADEHGVSRELAFYHVTKATAFTGTSSAAQPVTWFWNVFQTAATGNAVTDLKSSSRGGSTTPINWGTAGQSTYIAYSDKFREININVTRAAAAGWNGVWEYSTVDANGQVVWKTLNLLQDGTAGFTKTGTGTITFDPPADWKIAAAGSADATKYFYVRFRVTNGGTLAQAPQSGTVLGRDYVRANGGLSGTIPAFDAAADKNGDGYLNDAEYAARTAGMDARFVYETRLFYPYYGQMRFVTNPSSASVVAWAAEAHLELLNANPLADGFFVDNSQGKVPIEGLPVQEPTGSYSTDYGSMVSAVYRAVAPKWIIANTAGGALTADPTVAGSSGAFEEFLLRPLTTNWSEFGDVVDIVNRRLNTAGSPYLILDSSSDGGSPTDPRTQLSTLAYYYLVGDPERTFLMFFGGNNPASTWKEHWTDAVKVDIGQPTGAMKTIATGADPANAALTYKVFAREYTNGLSLYKPLSYAIGKGEGTTADATKTLVELGGSYKVVNADGTLGATPVTSVWLRNGEGVVLVKA